MTRKGAEGLREELWEGRSEPTADDLTFYDLHPLIKKPILLVSGEQMTVLDAAFCAAQAILGPLFQVAGGSSPQESRRIFGMFGKAFDSYCLETLRFMYPVPPPPLFDPLAVNLKAN